MGRTQDPAFTGLPPPWSPSQYMANMGTYASLVLSILPQIQHAEARAQRAEIVAAADPTPTLQPAASSLAAFFRSPLL